MGIFERKRMNDKTRLLTTETVLLYIDTAKQVNSDPMGLTKLPVTGAVFLGDELKGTVRGEKDSVWWVAVDPNTGRTTATQLGPDRSKWQRAIGDWLKRWGELSPVRARARKRGIAIGVVAAIVVAAVVIVVASGGTAAVAAGAAAPALSAGGAGGVGAGATGTAQAATAGKALSFSPKGLTIATKGGATKTIPPKTLLKATGIVSRAAQSGADAETQAALAAAELPPEDTAALKGAAEKEADAFPLEWVAAGVVGAAAVLGLALLLRDR